MSRAAPHILQAMHFGGRDYAPVEVAVFQGEGEEPLAIYRMRLRAARMLLAQLHVAIAQAEASYAPRPQELFPAESPALLKRQAE